MPLIPKVEMKQAKKIVSARLDEETHSMLQRYDSSSEKPLTTTSFLNP